MILRQSLHILILVRFENEMMAKIININKRFKSENIKNSEKNPSPKIMNKLDEKAKAKQN